MFGTNERSFVLMQNVDFLIEKCWEKNCRFGSKQGSKTFCKIETLKALLQKRGAFDNDIKSKSENVPLSPQTCTSTWDYNSKRESF